MSMLNMKNFNGHPKIVFIVGTPGSGKSYLGRKLAKELGGIFLDDTTNVRFFKHFAKKYQVLVNAHPCLCNPKQRNKAVEEILRVLPDAEFSWHFFENDYSACKENIHRRNDGRR